MRSLLIRRLLQFPLVLAAVYVVTFLLMAAAPGDPLLGADSKVPEEVLAEQRKAYGLDQPWYIQGLRYPAATVTHLLRGEVYLGRSVFYKGKPVAEILGLTSATWSTGAVRTSLLLGGTAGVLAVLAGVHLGVWAAVRRNGAIDHVAMGVAVIGVSVPPFVVGALLIGLLAVLVPLFPVGGWGRPAQLVLPAITLALPFTAYIARLMRAGMLDVLGADYVRTARAKGVTERRVIYAHAFKLAFLPVLSYLGPAAAAILTGSFVVEKLFAIPGVGQHFTASVLNRDRQLILATVLLYAMALVTFNLLVDLAYAFIDPRIRREGRP
ncbi:MAG: ABC transporter permease [Planctomycetota bacterium]